MRITATRVVQAPPEQVDAFLGDLENHWDLAHDWLEVKELKRDGAEVVVNGPLWISRRAWTRVRQRRPGLLAGTATDEAGTTARVVWAVDSGPRGTVVYLEATIDDARGRDRLLLLLGGRRWLRRSLRRSLRQLEDALQAR